MIGTRPTRAVARCSEPRAEQSGRFAERAAAGRLLAEQLRAYRGDHTLVLALPPGGVVVACALARALRLPLDVLVARAFYAPTDPSIIVGALSEGGGLCFNRAALRSPGVTLAGVWHAAGRTRLDVLAHVAVYRGARKLPLLNRRSIFLVDDGLGSGLPQLAALQALRSAHGYHVIVATPYATELAAQCVARHADGLIALARSQDRLGERGPQWSEPLDDDQAALLLKRYRRQIEVGGTSQPECLDRGEVWMPSKEKVSQWR
jgi:putative phosphoribosyl transferase